MDIVNVDEFKVHRFPMLGIESNMYIIVVGREALVIDPNINISALNFLRDNLVSKVTILLTHEHFDHISGVNWLRENYDCTVYCSEEASKAIPYPDKNLAKFWKVLVMDRPAEMQQLALKLGDENYSCKCDLIFNKNDYIIWCNIKIEVFLTPGHSKGSVIYKVNNIIFSGDSLVNGYGVICRLPGGNWKDYCNLTRSIICEMSDDTIVFPGHGEPNFMKKLRKYTEKFGKVE